MVLASRNQSWGTGRSTLSASELSRRSILDFWKSSIGYRRRHHHLGSQSLQKQRRHNMKSEFTCPQPIEGGNCAAINLSEDLIQRCATYRSHNGTWGHQVRYSSPFNYAVRCSLSFATSKFKRTRSCWYLCSIRLIGFSWERIRWSYFILKSYSDGDVVFFICHHLYLW